MQTFMTVESSPPPPPTSSPPPPLETTIGKYIARFRYEKPQPREARAAAQRSDFWWTKSPRYSPSPSPPSTWASGGVFRFPEDESEESEKEENTSQEKKEEEENAESVDSVESKLRRRLGVWSSDSRQEKEEKREVETSAKVLQLWDSVDWSLEGEEEEGEEEGGEDPEEVIARVRKRLGWGDTPSSVASTSGRWKPIELKLSVDGEEKKSEKNRQLKMKPPLSPGSYRRGGPLDTFGKSSRSSGGREDVSLSMASAEAEESRDPREEKVEEELGSVTESEEKMAAENVEFAEESDSLQMEMTPLNDDTNTRLDCSCMLVESSGLDGSTALVDLIEDKVTPVNESCSMAKEEESTFTECKVEDESDEESQLQTQEQGAAEVEEVPLLPTTSPARPEPVVGNAVLSSNSSFSSSHRSNSSSRGQSERVSAETPKTLDSLVSLVVHSWKNDFFSGSAIEQGPPSADTVCNDSSANNLSLSSAGGVLNAASAPASPSLCPPPPIKSIGETKETSANNQDEYPTTAELHTSTTPSTILQADIPNLSFEETTQLEKEEEKEDCEVPGEDDDQIVQMLLDRIALLEAALRQIDDS